MVLEQRHNRRRALLRVHHPIVLVARSHEPSLFRPDLNTKSATGFRELATYQQKLASGATATPPAGGARFEGGAGAPAPTEQELNAMAAKASTPADHRALEEYFLTLAKRYSADATAHATTASTYRGTRIAQAAVHCDNLVRLSKDAAKEATAAAEMHKQLANIAR